MIWLSWRQHRAETAALASVVALLCAVAVALGLAMSASFGHLGLAGCGRHCGPGGAEFINEFLGPSVIFGPLVLMAVPVLLGMFVGAPLVARELERGTHRLAWAQSVSRRRWFWVKVGFVLAVSCAAVAILTAALAWSTDGYLQFSKHNGGFDRIVPGLFDSSGVVPVAYTAFAVALGVALGTMLRRTLLAMMLVLVLFVAVRGTITGTARFHYQPQVMQTFPLAGAQNGAARVPEGSWIIDSAYVDRNGNVRHLFDCPIGESFVTCIPADRYRYFVLYQPADRFWRFQAAESAIYLLLAAGLVALAAWQVTRRLN
jgi:hypothetical protein